MRLLSIFLLLFSFLTAQSGVLDIKWPSPNMQHQKPSNPYPATLTNGIKNTNLPVYLPSTYAYNPSIEVVADRNFYTISILLTDATVMISGDRTFQEDIPTSNNEFQKIIKDTTVDFIQEEGIMSTLFNRHGANYELSVECNQPKEDKRCTEEHFLKNLYHKLIIIGGQA